MTTYSPDELIIVGLALVVAFVCAWVVIIRWALCINTIVARLEEVCQRLTAIEKQTMPRAALSAPQ